MLILAGTPEAAELARRAVPRFDVVSSLAGTTENPIRPPGAVRIGGFGGVEGLERFLRQANIDLVVDATHPFAARMQAGAVEACARVGLPRCRLLRPEWPRQAGDRWIEVDGPGQAAEALRALGPRVFLALGGRDMPAFSGLAGKWFLVRGVSPPPAPVANGLFVRGRGPFVLADERRLLRAHRIDVVVSRQSGGQGARAKIDAARDLGLPVVMIRRPPPPPAPVVTTPAAALSWLGQQAGMHRIAEPLAQGGPTGAV